MTTYPPRTYSQRKRPPIGNFRLLRKDRGVWKIVDDRVTVKMTPVGGVSLEGPACPAPLLEHDGRDKVTGQPIKWAYGGDERPLPRRTTSRHPALPKDNLSRGLPEVLLSLGLGNESDWPKANVRDLHYGDGKGQPGWLKPYKCWQPFGRIPVENADYERETWLSNSDPEGYRVRGRKPLPSGKRAPEGGSLPPTDTWHVSANWTSQGVFLPAMKWQRRQTACSTCWGPLPEERRRYCSDRCSHEGDKLRRRRKRALKSGRWPEPRYEKRRWGSTREEVADLQPLHLEVRRYPLRRWILAHPLVTDNIVTKLLHESEAENVRLSP